MLQWFRNVFKRGDKDKEFIDNILLGGVHNGEPLLNSTALDNAHGRETNPLVQRMMARKRPAMEIFAQDTDLKIPENLNVGQRQAYKALKYSELDDATKSMFEAKAVAEADGNKIDPAAAFEYVWLHTI